MGLLSWFGFGRRRQLLMEFLEREAVIIDVRMSGEFKTGNINGSQNIPLEDFAAQVEKIKQLNKPVITCCVSGVRSSVASRKLRKAGVEAVNGGSWYSVKLIVDHEI
jgi:rhodanese-related sulfurtransferase